MGGKMADGENKNDQQNLEQPPLTIITKVHGVDREWNYMKTVDYADEFEKIRTQHRMNFSGQSMFGKRTKYICQNNPKLRGGCKFKMLVQMSEDEESFHIYTADQHNHPIMDTETEDDNDDDQQYQSDNDETATNSICSSSKHPPKFQQNLDQKNERTKEKELTEDLKSVENSGNKNEQKLSTNSDQKSNKWRLIRTILGKPDAKLIKTEYEVASTDEKDEKRIMFFCLQENPTKCNFRMQLIKVPDSQNWKLYARFEHCHPLESEQILQQTNSRKRNISDDGKQKSVIDKTIPNNVQTPPKMFSLLDFKQNVDLLGSELNLNVREEGGCLIISSSNDPSRLLVLADEGKFIQVSEFKQNRHTGYSEDWQKSDLRQFLRAIHGRCEKYFFSTTKRPKIEEKMNNQQ